MIVASRLSFTAIFTPVAYELFVRARFRYVQCNFVNVSTIVLTFWMDTFSLHEKDIKEVVTQPNEVRKLRASLAASADALTSEKQKNQINLHDY